MITTLGTAAAAKLLVALTVLPTPTATEILAQLEQPRPSIKKATSLSPLAISPINATTATTVNSTASTANIELIEELELARPTTSNESIIGEIREWGLLEADWDGEGAVLPSTQSMKEAVSFVRLLDDEIMPPEPMLLASGHAALYWNANNLYADIEFLGDARISYFIKRSEDKHKGVLTFDSEKMPAVFSTLLKA